MTAYWLNRELIFPPPEQATAEGLIAIGGDASPERLLLAYSQGIFPWPQPGLPLLWFSPDPRFVLDLNKVHISRSLRKFIGRNPFKVKADTAFEAVITQCARTPRKDQEGTWITDELVSGYTKLNQKGYAHSLEVYINNELIGGLYGISLGGYFCGESMFSKRENASKVAFVVLAGQLKTWGFDFIDCQVRTEHLARFGARYWTRRKFLLALKKTLEKETRLGPWTLEQGPLEAMNALSDA